MSFLHHRGLAETHIDDYRRRNEEDVWIATFPTALPDDAYFDNWITSNGLEVLDRAPANRPWYLEVNFQNPHHPWDITESMHQLYRDPDVDFPPPLHSNLEVSAADHQEVRRNFAAMVEHLDQCLGRFVERLEERGELDNTLIVFSSAHGEMLGDYSQWQKLSPLQASVGVPLMIAGPGVATRGACAAPATILDLHATFLDVAGLEAGDEVDSRSMCQFLAGEKERHREVVLSGLSAWRLVFDGRYKLVRGYDPSKRRGGNDWEPMHVPAGEAARLQQERDPILYDIEGDERETIGAVTWNPKIHAAGRSVRGTAGAPPCGFHCNVMVAGCPTWSGWRAISGSTSLAGRKRTPMESTIMRPISKICTEATRPLPAARARPIPWVRSAYSSG